MGTEYAAYLDILSNISINLMQLHRVDEALIYGEKAWKLHEKQLGENHPVSMNHLKTYSVNLMMAGKTKEGVYYGKKLLDLYKKYGDPDGTAFMFSSLLNY
jgi:hypothetical protein